MCKQIARRSRSQRCLATRAPAKRLREPLSSDLSNDLQRIESMRRLFALRKRERTARKYDFSPAVIESNPCLFLSLPLLPCPAPIRIVDKRNHSDLPSLALLIFIDTLLPLPLSIQARGSRLEVAERKFHPLDTMESCTRPDV